MTNNPIPKQDGQTIDEIFDQYFPVAKMVAKRDADRRFAEIGTWLLEKRRQDFKKSIEAYCAEAMISDYTESLSLIKDQYARYILEGKIKELQKQSSSQEGNDGQTKT